MTLKDKITLYIREKDKNTFTAQELAKRFNLKAQDKKELYAALRRLVKEKFIVRQGRDRFALCSRGVVEGELRGNKRGFAFLIRESGEDIFIPARALNNAMHTDRVEVRLTGASEGEVVRIINEGESRLIGTYINVGRSRFVRPDDACFAKEIYIPKDKALTAAQGDKVIVNITSRKQGPKGEVVRVLGQAGEAYAEVLSILHTYGFEDHFPADVIEASTNLDLPKGKRLDLTALLTITIDGADAKDFDDAISLEKMDNGYRLYVHIADVAHFVKSGGVIDKEAARRTTSVYFPGWAFPMLPESISNGVCSLNVGEDKLTVSVIIDFDTMGRQVSTKFAETLIRSNYQMTYPIVTKILQGDITLRERYKEIVPMLEYADELADLIEQRRKEEGMIAFATQESAISLDNNKQVVDIAPYPYEVSNKIIEQFMIAANQAVAKFVIESAAPGIYRVHEKISTEKLEDFVSFIAIFGYTLQLKQGITPKLFSNFLEKIKGQAPEQIINKILLRSMQKARYDVANSGHFGLALADYCHFTAPIRRYPDLMMHRTLKALINNKVNDAFAGRHLSGCITAAKDSSEREVAAERAERDAKDYFKAIFMTKHIGEIFEGIISGIISGGFFVALDNTAEGFIALDSLGEGRCSVDGQAHMVKVGKLSLSLCDRVRIRVKAVSPLERRVDFEFLEKLDNQQ